MSSNTVSSAKRNKNRSGMPMSNIHNNQKPLNRNSIRNSNGQMASSVNNYNNQVPPTSLQNNVNVNKYSNSISSNNILDDIGTPNGVYKNSRLMHTATSLIGCLVEVQLVTGERYEGVLKTFSPEFDVVLFSAAKIVSGNSESNPDKTLGNVSNLLACLKSNSEISDTMVIQQDRMVKIKILNVDLDFATSKKNVLIDSEIAKTDSKKLQSRELVPWMDDETGGNCDLLEDSGISTNGWNSQDMFNYNENKYKLTTTYTEEMKEYTIQLDHRSDDEYRIKEAQAEKIAREIEKDVNRQTRLAKEDEFDDRDEETQFSAVVAKRDEPNLPSNISSPRSEISHSSRDDRREPLRNDGFRTQNRRSNRGINRNSAANDSNWRDTARDGRLSNSSRFNPPQTYNYSAKPPANTPGSSTSGYASSASTPTSKYPPANNVPLNQQFNPSSGPKTSYSAVSQRHAANDSLVSENEAKPLSASRGHGNKPEHYPNEDSYSRRSASGLPQRDNFSKQQRSSTSRNAEHDSPKPSQNNHAATPKSESEASKNLLSNNAPQIASTGLLPLSNESFESSPSGSQKAPSPAKSEASNNQQIVNKNKSIDDSQPISSHKAAVDTKKLERPSSQTPPSSAISSIETPKEEIEPKMVSPPTSPSAVTRASPNVPVDSSTPNSTSSEIAKSSQLNPNAKSFTPRITAPAFIPQSQMVPAYPYQTQHLSTTPPSAQSMQNQYIPISLPPQHHHHPQAHQQQQHQQIPRNYPMQFPYNIITTPQYINIPMGHMGPGGGLPAHTVFQGPVPTGVPPAVPPQPTGPNQAGPGGQLAPHHLVSNAAAAPQGVPNQSQQPQGAQPRGGPYRNKGSSNHNAGSNQVANQYLRQPHHDYNQQAQVANVTGQPIMAATAQQAPHQISGAYSTAASVHSGPHVHHHPNHSQQHGQPPNLAPPQMAPQPTAQGMQYMHYNFGRPINMLPQGHPQAMNQINLFPGGSYDPSTMPTMMLACDCPPQMVQSQQIPAAVAQQNPNMSAPNIPSAPSNPANANQVA